MSILKYLDTIIDKDPERFLKFISVGCDAIRFEEPCCDSCPMRLDNSKCVFSELTVVKPMDWDFDPDDLPKTDKDRSKLYMRRERIHIADILPTFKKKHAKPIEPIPFKLPTIPEFVIAYVDDYTQLMGILIEAVKSVQEMYSGMFCTDDLILQMNQKLQDKLHNLAEGNRMRFHIDYSNTFKLFDVQYRRQEIKEYEVVCSVLPKDPKRCYEAYNFLTTTEDIEYYTEQYNTKQFIKAYAQGVLTGGDYLYD